MCIQRCGDSRTMLTIGLAFLAVGNIWGFLVHRMLPVPEPAADAIHGFCLGIAITMMLAGIVRNTRNGSGPSTRAR